MAKGVEGTSKALVMFFYTKIDRNNISPDGLKYFPIARMPNLKELSLSNCETILGNNLIGNKGVRLLTKADLQL